MRNLFARFFERRGVNLQGGFTTVADLLATDTSAAGIVVTPERALGLPAVYACINVLAQDIGRTPIKLRRRIGPDSFVDVDATDHDLAEVLAVLPNPETSAYSLKYAMQFDLLVHERAYAEVQRVDGRIVALWRLDPTRMTVDRDETRRKRYRYTGANGESQTWLFDPSRPPILELSHPSPLRYCKELIGTALALQAYTGKFFSNGAKLGGVLATDATLSPASVDNIRKSFEAWSGGLKNAHKFAVLESGLKYQPVSSSNDDSQLNETMQALSVQICGVFRVPPFKISDLTRANYSNVESLSIEYCSGSLDPWFTVWEHAIRRDLLTTRQFGQFDVTFDRSALIRSDSTSQHAALSTGRQNGYYSANDVRKKLGENPIGADVGGDLYLVNGNMQPLTTTPEKGPSHDGN